MTTIGTLFSGGEGVGVGARQAGLNHLWGVEYDDAIAQIAVLLVYGTTVPSERKKEEIMSHTDLDDEIELRQKLEAELEQLRADMALLATENATYKQYGSCQDCGFPLDKTEDDDIVCHKCGDEIGDRMIAERDQRALILATDVGKLSAINVVALDLLKRLLENSREISEGDCIYCNCEIGSGSDEGNCYKDCIMIEVRRLLTTAGIRYEIPYDKHVPVDDEIDWNHVITSCIECEYWHGKGMICQRCFR